MKWLVVIAIFVMVTRYSDGKELSSISTTEMEDQGVKCKVGSEWERDCFKCTCPDSGIAQCVRVEKCDTKHAGPSRCKASTAYQRDCNRCFCVKGHIACTMLECASESRNIDMTDRAHLQMFKRCGPGTKWKSQCRDCDCSEFGVPICDLKDCPGENDEPLFECSPGSKWKDDCNDCWCTSDGVSFCTKMECLAAGALNLDDIKRSNKEAEDIKQLSDIAKSSQLKENKTICVANKMFIKDCNTCWCNEDGTTYSCTRRICIHDLEEEDKKLKDLRVILRQCRPDEVFELDCNMCRCNTDGKSYSCTRRACAQEPPGEPDLGSEKLPPLSRTIRASQMDTSNNWKTCDPGQEFRVDCNKCLCDHEGQDYSCTRNDCRTSDPGSTGKARRRREVARQAVNKCEPGSVFQQDCNVCRCSSDGHHATCTLKRCSLKPDGDKTKHDDSKSESDPNFRCNPGEQFKRGCDDCTCSADGKSVFCTLLLCDKEVYES